MLIKNLLMVSCDVLTKRYIQRRGIHLVHQVERSRLADREGHDEPYASVHLRAEDDLRIASRLSRGGVGVPDRVRHRHDRGHIVTIPRIRFQCLPSRLLYYNIDLTFTEEKPLPIVADFIEVFT